MPDLSTNINAALFPEELTFLNGLFVRAYQVIYGEDPIHDLREKEEFVKTDNIRVALISFKMPPIKHSTKHVNRENYDYGTFEYECLRYRYDHEMFKPGLIYDAVDECMEFHDETGGKPINYILFNELAISMEKHDEVIEHLRNNYAKKKEIYIIPGSFQCIKGGFNVAPIISPWSKEKFVLKQNCAKYQKEKIRTPDYRSITIFKTIHGVTSVWICLDLYDPALVLKLLANNMRLSRVKREIIDIIFVPSFNNESKKNVCNAVQFISKVTGTGIFLANGFLKEGGWVDNMGFFFGEETPKVHDTENDKYKFSVFDLDWKGHKEKQNRPFTYGLHSSLFDHIIGARESSIQNVPY